MGQTEALSEASVPGCWAASTRDCWAVWPGVCGAKSIASNTTKMRVGLVMATPHPHAMGKSAETIEREGVNINEWDKRVRKCMKKKGIDGKSEVKKATR